MGKYVFWDNERETHKIQVGKESHREETGQSDANCMGYLKCMYPDNTGLN